MDRFHDGSEVFEISRIFKAVPAVQATPSPPQTLSVGNASRARSGEVACAKARRSVCVSFADKQQHSHSGRKYSASLHGTQQSCPSKQKQLRAHFHWGEKGCSLYLRLVAVQVVFRPRSMVACARSRRKQRSRFPCKEPALATTEEDVPGKYAEVCHSAECWGGCLWRDRFLLGFLEPKLAA